MSRGKFVVFEGIDGSGKSTLAQHVFGKYMNRKDQKPYRDVILTCEPTSGQHGKLVRETHGTERLLEFLLDRREHNCKIALDVDRGDLVLCDRYWPSTVVYQGLLLSKEVVAGARRLQGPDESIDLLVVVDTPVSVCIERIQQKRVSNFPNLDFEKVDFLTKAAVQYQQLIRDYAGNLLIANGMLPVEELADQVFREIEGL